MFMTSFDTCDTIATHDTRETHDIFDTHEALDTIGTYYAIDAHDALLHP